MKKTLNIIIIVSFVAYIGIIGVLNIFDQDEKTSFYENRELAQRPDLTVESIKSGTYFERFDNYYSDQFYEKENILTTYSKIEDGLKTAQKNILQFKGKVIDGYYVRDDGWIMQIPNPAPEEKEIIEDYANNINVLANQVAKNGTEIFYFNLPFKSSMLLHLYPKYLSKEKDNENRDYLLSLLNTNTINLFDVREYFNETLTEEQQEKYYFKTDHHWNQEGADYAFERILEFLNERTQYDVSFEEPVPSKLVCVDDENFMGSWNRLLHGMVDTEEKTCYKAVAEELKDTIKIKQTNRNNIIEVPYTDVYGYEGKKAEDNVLTYARLSTEDYFGLAIENMESKTDKTLVVLKDSYFNPLVISASEYFRKVVVLDPRHVVHQTTREYLLNNHFDYLWFFYSDDGYFMPRMFEFDVLD